MNHQKPETRNQKPSSVAPPPKTLSSTLRKLGPGIIIAGSIVGSGELIATTKVGAEAGFWLLWLIVIGCVIKVFAQIEMGRYTITWNETPLMALNKVPGPRWKVNWIVWYWTIMTMLIISQQGGIVGGVGQALAISQPLTEQGASYNELQDQLVSAQVQLAIHTSNLAPGSELSQAEASSLADRIAELATQVQNVPAIDKNIDAYIWATIMALLTSVLMFIGHYGMIQSVSTVLVASFSLITVVTLVLLQFTPWGVTGSEFTTGLRFQLPQVDASSAVNPVTTALAAFGIIGMGAGELLMYPYWCLEKGYAKYTGLREQTESWLNRAKGWLRVLQIDAWSSMFVYTFTTVIFYLLGAAVLWRTGLNPNGSDMVRTLSEMYVPVFGEWAQPVFLFGAIAVLYSTFFVVAAGYSRMVADAFGLFGFHDGSEESRLRWTKWISAIWPIVALITYIFVANPVAMVLASGVAQAVMLPMLAVAILYFRYKRTDKRLIPGRVWDIFLWVSSAGLIVAGLWSLYQQLT